MAFPQTTLCVYARMFKGLGWDWTLPVPGEQFVALNCLQRYDKLIHACVGQGGGEGEGRRGEWEGEGKGRGG